MIVVVFSTITLDYSDRNLLIYTLTTTIDLEMFKGSYGQSLAAQPSKIEALIEFVALEANRVWPHRALSSRDVTSEAMSQIPKLNLLVYNSEVSDKSRLPGVDVGAMLNLFVSIVSYISASVRPIGHDQNRRF